MSQGNLEIVRDMIDAWNRSDFERFVAQTHAEVEWSSAIERQVEGADNVYRGRDGLRRFWDEWTALWKAEIVLAEMREVGDSVVVVAQVEMTGETSGVAVDRRFGYLFEFEGSLIRRFRAYFDPETALEAAGLE